MYSKERKYYLEKIVCKYLLFHGKFALTVEGVQVESDVGEGADAHLEAAGEGLKGASLAGSESVANGSLQLMGVPVGHAY